MTIAFNPLELGKTDILIETGTYNGSFVRKFQDQYRKIHTIEIVRDFFDKAKADLAQYPNIQCHFGHSPGILVQILDTINEPATFWLDAHYQGGLQSNETKAPILDELKAIATHHIKTHIIMIDDVRLFEVNYKTTKGEVESHLHKINPDYQIKYMPGAEPGDVLVAIPPCGS